MANHMNFARSELILGGQKSGKSRRAEALARDWLALSPAHSAVLIATARSGDGEMRERITRHQLDRATRVPGMTTVEEPLALAESITQHSDAHTLLVVDCLTLWLTNWLMPAEPLSKKSDPSNLLVIAAVTRLLNSIGAARGPVVLVGNEIGLGVIPLGAEVRAFVDALGTLNQNVAGVCERVTLMAAGLPLTLKGTG
jgi:adenosylcobinamide kinase / adenosylcobinamide-phosphate guanylyltransferase